LRHKAAELGQLVEEQHAVVGQRHLAGLGAQAVRVALKTAMEAPVADL
jgi:hypothetical protein